jgi:hypothetical protein
MLDGVFLFDTWLSILTITTIWLVGNRSPATVVFGLLTELSWICAAVYHDRYGLILLPTVLIIIWIRNHLKWRKEDV